MKFIQLKIVPFFKKNIEVLLLISLLIITIFITQLYNVNTKKVQKDYLEILRNSYFKKTVGYLFSNLNIQFISSKLFHIKGHFCSISIFKI